MEDGRKWINVFVVVFIAVSVAAIIPAVVGSQRNFDTRSNAAEEAENTQDEVSGAPRVVSVDPSVAYVGEEFNYFLKIVDSDTSLEDIEITLFTAPSWLFLDESNMRLYGTPTMETSDTVKIELTISDGRNKVPHTFYLLLLESDE